MVSKLPRTRTSGDGGLIPVISMIMATVVLFSCVTIRHATHATHRGDYYDHIRWAQEMATTGIPRLPHCLYHQLVIVVRTLIPFELFDLIRPGLAISLARHSFTIAGVLVPMLCYVILSLLLYDRAQRELSGLVAQTRQVVSALLAVSLMLVAPVNLFTVFEHRLYLGYIGINVYHNPTVLLLKALALPLFWIVSDHLTVEVKPITTLFIAALTAITTMAKPNYTMCLVPALAVWSLWRLWQKKNVNGRFVIYGVLAPALLTLAYQYWIAFSSDQSGGGILFAPLLAMGHYASAARLGAMFLGSILFPLGTSILYPELRKEQRLVLAWLTFLVGSFMAYFLAEDKYELSALNLVWGAQVALFILFVEVTFFVMRSISFLPHPNQRSKVSKRTVVSLLLFGLHLISGLAWYMAEVIWPRQWW